MAATEVMFNPRAPNPWKLLPIACQQGIVA
jgi:hypothetical protein